MRALKNGQLLYGGRHILEMSRFKGLLLKSPIQKYLKL